MFAVFGYPAHVEDKLALNFSFGGDGFVSLNSERSKNDITLLISSVSFDKESSFLQNTIESDFFALPVIGFTIVERVKEVFRGLIVIDSINELSLSLVLLIGDIVLE